MNEIKQCSSNIIAVNVPDRFHTFSIVPATSAGAHKGAMLRSRTDLGNTSYISLPPGDWTILLDTSKVTEEDAKRVVDSVLGEGEYIPNTYRNYLTNPPYQYFNTALESFATYLVHYGINEGRHILLVNKNHKS